MGIGPGMDVHNTFVNMNTGTFAYVSFVFFFIIGVLIKRMYFLVDIRTSTPRVPNYDMRYQGFRPHAPVGLNTDIPLQQFSAKHNGLYLYVGRILRPIWSMRCIKQETVNNKIQVK